MSGHIGNFASFLFENSGNGVYFYDFHCQFSGAEVHYLGTVLPGESIKTPDV